MVEDMSYKIVVDSCCELPEEMLQSGRFERVPLGIEIGDYHLLDARKHYCFMSSGTEKLRR